jgi:hypothetical protein
LFPGRSYSSSLTTLAQDTQHTRIFPLPLSGNVGNEEADEAARAASSRKDKPSAPASERVREAEGVIRLTDRSRNDNPTPFDSTRLAGQYKWKMDQALPGKHTLQPYRALKPGQTATLIRTRTGHCRMNRYLAKIGLVKNALCECERGEETIGHVILSCVR